MRTLLISLALAATTTACSEQVHVDVKCLTTKSGVDCTVKQDRGKSEVEACWDFAVTCGNGAVVTADRTCTKIGNGGTATVNVPETKLHGLDKCEAKDGTPPKATLSKMTINGESSEP